MKNTVQSLMDLKAVEIVDLTVNTKDGQDHPIAFCLSKKGNVEKKARLVAG